MQIDFRDQEMRDIPPELIAKEYYLQMDMFKRSQKQQFDHNFLYLKLMGLFVLVSATYFVLQTKDVLVNFLIGTTIVGVGTLYIMLSIALFLDPQRDREVVKYIKIGKFIEKKYPKIITTQLFHRFDELQTNGHLGAMLSRFGSFALVLILTTAASIPLSMGIGSCLAISISIFSAMFLISAAFFFSWITKKNFQVREYEGTSYQG